MNTQCSGDGACWTRDSSKCIRATDHITCGCFITGRQFEMNGYCKPTVCIFGCELLRCMTCATVHPLRNMPGNNGRQCKRCAAIALITPIFESINAPQSRPIDAGTASLDQKDVNSRCDAVASSRDLTHDRCRICGESSLAMADCERRHFKELNKILPVFSGPRGERRLTVHNLNFGNYTMYGRVVIIACYFKSDPPGVVISRQLIEEISQIRIALAEALRLPPARCVATVAKLTGDISPMLNTMFKDCPGILIECLGHMMNICIAAASAN